MTRSEFEQAHKVWRWRQQIRRKVPELEQRLREEQAREEPFAEYRESSEDELLRTYARKYGGPRGVLKHFEQSLASITAQAARMPSPDPEPVWTPNSTASPKESE